MSTIDTDIPRFSHGCVAVLTAVAFVTGIWLIVPFVAGVLALGLFGGPRYAMFTQVYVRFIRPHVHTSTATEPSAPIRFAQLLGMTMLAAASVSFIVGLPLVGWPLTLVVMALATLAAVTRICVGCVIYERISS